MAEIEYKDLDKLFIFYQKRHKNGGQLTRNEVKLIESFLYDVFYEDEKPKYKIIETQSAKKNGVTSQ